MRPWCWASSGSITARRSSLSALERAGLVRLDRAGSSRRRPRPGSRPAAAPPPWPASSTSPMEARSQARALGPAPPPRPRQFRSRARTPVPEYNLIGRLRRCLLAPRRRLVEQGDGPALQEHGAIAAAQPMPRGGGWTATATTPIFWAMRRPSVLINERPPNLCESGLAPVPVPDSDVVRRAGRVRSRERHRCTCRGLWPGGDRHLARLGPGRPGDRWCACSAGRRRASCSWPRPTTMPPRRPTMPMPWPRRQEAEPAHPRAPRRC